MDSSLLAVSYPNRQRVNIGYLSSGSVADLASRVTTIKIDSLTLVTRS